MTRAVRYAALKANDPMLHFPIPVGMGGEASICGKLFPTVWEGFPMTLGMNCGMLMNSNEFSNRSCRFTYASNRLADDRPCLSDPCQLCSDRFVHHEHSDQLRTSQQSVYE
jgi:hypothetical protein